MKMEQHISNNIGDVPGLCDNTLQISFWELISFREISSRLLIASSFCRSPYYTGIATLKYPASMKSYIQDPVHLV